VEEAGAPPPARAICPVLAGPTAVGKTGLILELAERHPCEIISLDSRQIYRGLRIGTAQPTAAEQARCRHHLVDFLAPDESYSAARYRQDFIKVFREIRGRGRVPLLVGGAGLYLRALRRGLFELTATATAAVLAVRAELDGLSEAEIRRRLGQLDPESARRIHRRDRYRSQRALELCLATGCSMTRLKAEQGVRPALGLHFPLILLERSAAELDGRIARRTEAMLANGWIAETEELLDRYGPRARGLATLGYREVVAHLQGHLSREELGPRIILLTRQYAKRQRTWFRPVRRLLAGPPESPDVRRQLAALLDAAERATGGEGPGLPS
jgi:tRNA dimethylallyltransferase